MKGWNYGILSDLIYFQRGFDITKAQQKEGRIPVVSSSGISSYHNEYKQIGPGIVIGRKGTLGSVHFIKENFWPHDTTLWSKEINGEPRFIYYLLKTLKLEQYDVGNANPTLNRNHIHKLKISYPNEATQKKIGVILSSYDDLIENNLKRIKLLEEMAQITYEEWFVRLRFPGHESTLINPETDLPVGWEKPSLSQIGEYLNGYAFKPKDLGDEGMPIIKIKEIKGGVVNDTPRNTGETIPEKYLVETGQILFSWSASLEVVVWQYERGLLNQHLFKVTPKKGVSKAFLFLALKDALKVFDGLTTGATMKHIKRKELDFVRTAVPDNRVMQEFDVLVGAVIEEILNLSKQNQRLREARDILLPRLIAGVIDVEKYDPAQLLKEAA